MNIFRSFSVLPEEINLSERTGIANFTKIAKLREFQKFTILGIFVKFAALVMPFWRFYSGF